MDRADPKIRIDGELIRNILRYGDITDDGEFILRGTRSGVDFTNRRLVIRGVNRTVIYRIDEYLPYPDDCYVAEWPD